VFVSLSSDLFRKFLLNIVLDKILDSLMGFLLKIIIAAPFF